MSVTDTRMRLPLPSAAAGRKGKMKPISLGELVERLSHMDYYYAYSDDYRVYARGRDAADALRADIKAADLSEAEKRKILAEVPERKKENAARFLGVELEVV